MILLVGTSRWLAIKTLITRSWNGSSQGNIGGAEADGLQVPHSRTVSAPNMEGGAQSVEFDCSLQQLEVEASPVEEWQHVLQELL